jgi:hypothetical protein
MPLDTQQVGVDPRFVAIESLCFWSNIAHCLRDYKASALSGQHRMSYQKIHNGA